MPGQLIFPTTAAYAVFTAISIFPLIVRSAEPARVTYDRLDSIQHNTTALHDTRAPAWVNNPELRGTASILFSCVLTLFACIYKALHLNIPDENSGILKQLMDKAKWMLTCLFAPEWVVWIAFDQFLTAWEVSKHLTAKQKKRSGEASKAGSSDPIESNAILNSSEGVTSSSDDEVGVERPNLRNEQKKPSVVSSDLVVRSEDDGTSKFDLKYGFFVLMGGLELPKQDDGARILSVYGIRWLADHGELLHVSRGQILDRSKADTVQKALVMFQVGWMALQCIARKAYGLPLALLEIHTMVHVVCAILMYGLWWEKPLDVRSSGKIQLDQDVARQFADVNNAIIDRKKRCRENNPGMIPDLEAGESDKKKVDITQEYGGQLFYPTRTNIPATWDFILGDYDKDFEIQKQKLCLVLFVALPLLYGGIHLAAWRSEFPTHTEAIIWKVAAIYIASAFLGFAHLCLMFWYLESLPAPFSLLASYLNKSGLYIFLLLLLLLIPCRVYIVVESFISLRSVPIGVYWTPSWIQMIPHF